MLDLVEKWSRGSQGGNRAVFSEAGTTVMLTSTSVFCRPTLYLPTQGPTLTLSNHKPTTPQYWTEPVKELCAYISQSERPTITNCRTRPVPNGPTKAIRSSGGIALYEP